VTLSRLLSASINDFLSFHKIAGREKLS
jgi:hypothetical protein